LAAIGVFQIELHERDVVTTRDNNNTNSASTTSSGFGGHGEASLPPEYILVKHVSLIRRISHLLIYSDDTRNVGATTIEVKQQQLRWWQKVPKSIWLLSLYIVFIALIASRRKS
jgi:hypothetical protein